MIRFELLRSVRGVGAVLWLPLVVASGISCHKGTSAATEAAETSGTLVVTVAAPPATFPNVTVTGPSAFDIAIAGTDTLIDLGAGKYTVSALTVASTDEVVSTVYTGVVTGSPVTVAIDDTSNASVAYTVRPGTGGLWVGSSNGGSPIAALYTSGELRANQSAGVSVSVGDAYAVIDADGDLWIASRTGNTLTEYLSTQLASSGAPQPAVTITGGGLNGPDGLAFDPSGNLWVSNATGSTVVEYAAQQLTVSGNPTPVIAISGSALSAPARLSFDVYGNLWVPNPALNTVVQFSAPQLRAGGSLTPAITITAVDGSFDSPQALAFDADGNLWVANLSNNMIVEYSPGQLLVGGGVTPAGILTVAGGRVSLAALAFDNSGGLWTTSVSTSQLLQFTPDQVIAAGSQPPGLTLAVAAGPTSLAFNPAPDGLPIVSPSTSRVARPAGHVRRR
jgi:sugar lactone lactonase YvrE